MHEPATILLQLSSFAVQQALLILVCGVSDAMVLNEMKTAECRAVVFCAECVRE